MDNLGFHQFEYLYYIVLATAEGIKRAQVFGTQAISIFVRLRLNSRLPQLLGVVMGGIPILGEGTQSSFIYIYLQRIIRKMVDGYPPPDLFGDHVALLYPGWAWALSMNASIFSKGTSPSTS